MSSTIDNVNKFMPILMTGLFWSIRGFDWNEGNRLLYLRVMFGLVQFLSVTLMIILRSKILNKNEDRMIQVERVKNPFQEEENVDDMRSISVCTYDLEKWNELAKASGFQLLLLMFFHYKWGYAVPLLSQCLMGTSRLFANELFKSHMLGETLERPFPKPKSPFGDMFAAFTGGGTDTAATGEGKKKAKAKPIDPPSGTKSKLKKRK